MVNTKICLHTNGKDRSEMSTDYICEKSTKATTKKQTSKTNENSKWKQFPGCHVTASMKTKMESKKKKEMFT